MYIIINGGGKVGSHLASVMLDKGNDVAVIEQDRETATNLAVRLRGRSLVINGDGCDSKFQDDAGIHHADVFVTTTGQDDSNLVACEIARRVFNVPRCIARVSSPKNLRIFQKLGIESVSSTNVIANLIEEEALMGSMGVTNSLIRGNVQLIEVAVPHMRHHGNVSGVAVSAVPMPEGSIIAAVSRGDDTNVVSPDTLLYQGDSVVVVTDTSVVDEVRAVFKSL